MQVVYILLCIYLVSAVMTISACVHGHIVHDWHVDYPLWLDILCSLFPVVNTLGAMGMTYCALFRLWDSFWSWLTSGDLR
jgi:hypothetical protein